MAQAVGKEIIYPIFFQVIWQIGNHDLSLGRHTVLGGTTLLALARSSLLARGSGVSTLVSCKRFVRGLGKWKDLARYICRSAIGRGSVDEFNLLGTLSAVSLLASG